MLKQDRLEQLQQELERPRRKAKPRAMRVHGKRVVQLQRLIRRKAAK